MDITCKACRKGHEPIPKPRTVYGKDGTVLCQKCKQFRSKSEFHKSTHHGRGFVGRCIHCCKGRRQREIKDVLESGFQKCKTCNIVLPLSEFCKLNNTPYRTCKRCFTAKHVKTPDEHGRFQCSECFQWKPIAEFGKATRNPHGRSTTCKNCNKQRTRNRTSASMRSFLQARIGLTLTCIRNGSVRRQAFYGDALDVNYLMTLYTQQSGRCAISGVQMTHIFGAGRQPTNASIDRINCQLGYIKGNVRLVCSIVNTMRSDLDDEELVEWARLILNNQRMVNRRKDRPQSGQAILLFDNEETESDSDNRRTIRTHTAVDSQ